MPLEFALETLRSKTLHYKSIFEKDRYLTGIFDFDSILGGFSKDKTYRIVGQNGCCPLLFCNLILDNMAFFHRLAFSEIAKFVRPISVDSESQNMLILADLDEETAKQYDVIIALYRPTYFGIEKLKDGTTTKNQIDFKIIKGAENTKVSGRLSIDFKSRSITSLSVMPKRNFIEQQLKSFQYEHFEEQLSCYVKQVALKNLSPVLQAYFKKNYTTIYDQLKSENAQLVYLNEPNPILFSYTEDAEQQNFIQCLKPDNPIVSLSLDNIQNLLALYGSAEDFKVYYKGRNAVQITPLIESFLQKTNNWILYPFQLEQILKAYVQLQEEELQNIIKHILDNHKSEVAFLEDIHLENGLPLFSQIDELLLPSRQLYEPNLFVGQKIFNYIQLNNL